MLDTDRESWPGAMGLNVIRVTRKELKEMIKNKVSFESNKGCRTFFVRDHANFLAKHVSSCRKQDYFRSLPKRSNFSY